MIETNECFLEAAGGSNAAPLKVDMPKEFPVDLRCAFQQTVLECCGELEIVNDQQDRSPGSERWDTNAEGDNYRTVSGGKPGYEGKVTDYNYNAAGGTRVSINDIRRNDAGAVYEFKIGDETWFRADDGKSPERDPGEQPYGWVYENNVSGDAVRGLIDLGHIDIDETGFHSQQPNAHFDGRPAVEYLHLDGIFKERGLATR